MISCLFSGDICLSLSVSSSFAPESVFFWGGVFEISTAILFPIKWSIVSAVF